MVYILWGHGFQFEQIEASSVRRSRKIRRLTFVTFVIWAIGVEWRWADLGIRPLCWVNNCCILWSMNSYRLNISFLVWKIIEDKPGYHSFEFASSWFTLVYYMLTGGYQHQNSALTTRLIQWLPDLWKMVPYTNQLRNHKSLVGMALPFFFPNLYQNISFWRREVEYIHTFASMIIVLCHVCREIQITSESLLNPCNNMPHLDESRPLHFIKQPGRIQV